MAQNKDFNYSLRFAGVDKLSSVVSKMQKSVGGASRELRELKSLEKKFGKFRDLRDGSKKLQSEINGASDAAERMGRELAGTSNPTKKATADFDRARAAVQKLKTQQTKEIAELAKLGKGLKAAGYNTQKFGGGQRKLKSDIARSTKELEQHRRELKRVSDQYKKQGAAKAKYQESLQTSANMAIVGASGVAVGKKTIGGVFGLTQTVRELSKANGELKTLGITDADLAELKPDFAKLASDYAYVTEESLARSHYTTISTFAAKYEQEMMPKITGMAAIMGRALKSDAETMTSLLKTADGSFRAYMPELSDMEFFEKVAGTISGAVKVFATDGEEMRGALKNLGGEASARGLDLPDQITMLGMLQSAGLSGTEAGTAAKSYAVNTAKADEYFQKQGIDLRFLGDDNQMLGTYEVLQNIKSAYGDVIDATELYQLKQGLGSDEAARVFTTLLPMMDKYKNNVDELNTLGLKGMSGVKDMARGAEDSDDAKLQRAAEEFSTMKRELGTALVPVFTDMIPMMQAFSAWFGPFVRDNKGLIKNIGMAIVIFGTMAAVMGGITITIASMLGPFAALKFATTTLGLKGVGLTRILGPLSKGLLFVGRAAIPPVIAAVRGLGIALMSTPVGWIIGAVALIGLAAYMLIKHWKPVKAFFGHLFAWLKKTFSKSITGRMIIMFASAFKKLIALLGGPKAAARKAWAYLKFLFKWSPLGILLRVFGVPLKWLSKMFGGTGESAGKAWRILKTILKWSPMGVIFRAWMDPVKFISELMDMPRAAAVAAWAGIKRALKWSPAGVLLRTIGIPLKWLSTLFSGPEDTARASWQALKTILSWSPLGFILSKWNELPELFTGVFTSVTDEALASMDKVTSVITAPLKLLGKLKNALSLSGVKAKIKMPKLPRLSGVVKTGVIGSVAMAPMTASAMKPGPDLSRSPTYRTAPVTITEGETTIVVHASKGMDEKALAKAVADALAKQKRDDARKRQNVLNDIGDW